MDVLWVVKFGGTSLATPEKIRNAAEKVSQFWREGHRLIVVVSAMAGETNRLVSLTQACSNAVDLGCEADVVMATGEQVVAGLFALCLLELGVPARSRAGWQVPIITDSVFGRARVISAYSVDVQSDLDAGCVVVVTGFQGVTTQGHVTVLGRGGSDTTAVVLAVAYSADVCRIYTDVDGVYTADPGVVSDARLLDIISAEDMLELASSGAKVLHCRSVELALLYSVHLQVMNAANNDQGTTIMPFVRMNSLAIEKKIISGIAVAQDEARITVWHVEDTPEVLARIFEPVALAGINVDLVIKSVASSHKTDVTFSLPLLDLEKVLSILESEKDSIGYESLSFDDQIAKISVVGIGMLSHPGVAAKVFRTLADHSIKVYAVGTTEIKISLVVGKDSSRIATVALHKAFSLDSPVRDL